MKICFGLGKFFSFVRNYWNLNKIKTMAGSRKFIGVAQTYFYNTKERITSRKLLKNEKNNLILINQYAQKYYFRFNCLVTQN